MESAFRGRDHRFEDVFHLPAETGRQPRISILATNQAPVHAARTGTST